MCKNEEYLGGNIVWGTVLTIRKRYWEEIGMGAGMGGGRTPSDFCPCGAGEGWSTGRSPGRCSAVEVAGVGGGAVAVTAGLGDSPKEEKIGEGGAITGGAVGAVAGLRTGVGRVGDSTVSCSVLGARGVTVAVWVFWFTAPCGGGGVPCVAVVGVVGALGATAC